MSLLDQTLNLALEKPVYGGASLGFHNGKAVLVPFGIPGETAPVTIIKESRDYCIGKIEPLSAGPSGARIVPACANFTQCGGCSYLHVSYATEIMLKRRILEDNLARIAGLSGEAVPGIKIVSGPRFNYRSHAEIKVKGSVSGFFRKGSHDLIPIPETGCLLLPEEINGFVKSNRKIQNNYKVALDASGVVTASFHDTQVITEHAGGLILQRGINQFFQANRFLRQHMLETADSYAAVSADDNLLDIGCGVGFFILHLARNAMHGTGIDISRKSIRWAKHNAAMNSIVNVDFFTVPSSGIHPVRHYAGIAVIDPPRAGIDVKTRKTIRTMNPRRIVYVSCNPSTFSRDAKDFIRAGYTLEKITLIDMFPCTHHIELMSLFTRA
jgi:23S rRNA (uracil1939-C5)-methyltransferase